MFLRSAMVRFLQRIAIVAVLLALASCAMPGEPVAGIPDDSAWYSLNFDEMIHAGDAQPEALSFCATENCPKRLVVGAIIVSGKSVTQLENLLRHPSLLAAELKRRAHAPTLRRAARIGSKQHIETVTTVAPLKNAPADGFTVAMARRDGKGRIDAAVLGWREGDKLHVVIAIGDDAGAVEAIAVRAATQYMRTDAHAGPGGQ